MYHTTKSKLIACIHAAKQGKTIKTGMWERPTFSPDEFQAWFRKCLDTKINSHAPVTGRKLSPDYQLSLRLDAWKINEYGRRIRHTGSTGLLRLPEFQAKYPHIHNQREVQ